MSFDIDYGSSAVAPYRLKEYGTVRPHVSANGWETFTLRDVFSGTVTFEEDVSIPAPRTVPVDFTTVVDSVAATINRVLVRNPHAFMSSDLAADEFNVLDAPGNRFQRLVFSDTAYDVGFDNLITSNEDAFLEFNGIGILLATLRLQSYNDGPSPLTDSFAGVGEYYSGKFANFGDFFDAHSGASTTVLPGSGPPTSDTLALFLIKSAVESPWVWTTEPFDANVSFHVDSIARPQDSLPLTRTLHWWPNETTPQWKPTPPPGSTVGAADDNRVWATPTFDGWHVVELQREVSFPVFS